MKKNYLDQVFHELEPKYNAINLTFVIVLYVMAITFVFRSGFMVTVIVDSVAAIIGTFIHIFRHRIRLQNKMLLTICVLFIFSTQSLIRGGFVGNGLIGLTLIIVISLTFLDRWAATTFSLLTVGLLLLLSVLAFIGLFDLKLLNFARYIDPLEWVFQTISLGLFALVTYFSIYSIRKMLLGSIEELSELAYKDQLTGLSNRNYFFERLPEDKASEINKTAIIAILDIINFRMINTFYGVEKGDQLLKSIARITTENKTEKLSLSRIGSNEFALFALDWNKEDLAVYYRTCTDDLLSGTK